MTCGGCNESIVSMTIAFPTITKETKCKGHPMVYFDCKL